MFKENEAKQLTEHSSIQKDSVHCTVGAVHIAYLLSSICSSGVFGNAEYTEFSYVSRMASYSHFSLSQLVIKPDSLLLEDQRSKTSGKRDNQKNVLFMELVLICCV